MENQSTPAMISFRRPMRSDREPAPNRPSISPASVQLPIIPAPDALNPHPGSANRDDTVAP